MRRYYDDYYQYIAPKSENSGASNNTTPSKYQTYFEKLEQEYCILKDPPKKCHEIQEYTQKIAHSLNAVRFIQCKSAKDRTSMGYSLEQAHILKDFHHLHSTNFNDCLEQIRIEGLGLTRCYKNIGKYCYAFNAFQLSTFPSEYRAPSSVCGATAS